MDYREAYIDHLQELIKDLEQARKDAKDFKGVHRMKAIQTIALAADKVGNQLRAWDKKFDRESEKLTDVERLDDLRTWLRTLPKALRRKFYRDCSVDELTEPDHVALQVV